MFYRKINSSLAIFIILILATLVALVSLQISTPKKDHVNLTITPAETSKKEVISRFENNIYTNTKYYFQVVLPNGWTYKEFDRGSDPVIIFYKNSPDNPFDNANGASHFTQGTFVLIAPQGISTEGIPGVTLPSTVKFSEKIRASFDYPLINRSTWATITNFENYPSGVWNESGFLFGSNMVFNKQTICTRKDQEIDLSQCNYYEDSISYKGTINKTERKQVEAVLNSFKFLPVPVLDSSLINDNKLPKIIKVSSNIEHWKKRKVGLD